MNGLHFVQWETQLLHSNNDATCSAVLSPVTKYIFCCL